MRTLLFAVILVGVLIACKNNDVELKPTCSNIVLEKVDWTYCRLHNNIYPIKCNDNNDTLTVRILKYLDNYTGIVDNNNGKNITVDKPWSGLKEDGRVYTFRVIRAFNLPECFQKEGLKIKFSGNLRPSFGVDDSGGESFELTKIEVIP